HLVRYLRTIHHRFGAYPVTVAAGLAPQFADAIRGITGSGKCVLVVDSEVDRLYPTLLGELPRIVFPAGEQSKNREQWAAITDRLIELGADRRTSLVSLGGGVASDLTGFVAATYMRGLRWIAIP